MSGFDPIEAAFEKGDSREVSEALRLLRQTSPWLVLAAIAGVVVAVGAPLIVGLTPSIVYVVLVGILGAILLLRLAFVIRRLQAVPGRDALLRVVRAHRALWLGVAVAAALLFALPCAGFIG